MKKKRLGALALTVCLAAGGCALAEQTLPSNDLFSPGLVRLSEKMAQNPAVSADAQVTIDDAFYARDLSLLKSMLEGTTFHYESGEAGESLRIERGEKTMGEYALDGDMLVLNGQAYMLDGEQGTLEQMTGAGIPGYEAIARTLEMLQSKAILEKAPLASVADFLEGLKVGDALPFGFRVTQAIELERTMSDDGTRLTRVDFRAGAIGREGEAPYVITGYMRQPAGRAPKDTFELVVTQDERNFMELSYSALRENSVASKNKKGETKVRTQLKAAGRVAGSGISSRLTVNMTNAWTADGEALTEKVTVSATLTHQDNTPGREMQRLNAADVKLRQVIRLTTHDAGDEVIAVTDDVTFEAVMNDKTFLIAGADVSMEIGGEEKADAVSAGAAAAAKLPLDAAMENAVHDLAAAVYAGLDDKAREKATDGLE